MSTSIPKILGKLYGFPKKFEKFRASLKKKNSKFLGHLPSEQIFHWNIPFGAPDFWVIPLVKTDLCVTNEKQLLVGVPQAGKWEFLCTMLLKPVVVRLKEDGIFKRINQNVICFITRNKKLYIEWLVLTMKL